MTLLASDVMAAAAANLNDPAQTSYTNTALLPHLRTAMKMLQSKILENGISVIEVKNSATITIAAITGVVISAATNPALPTDLLKPIELSERPSGSSWQFSPMHECEELPKRPQGLYLMDWTWENEQINLVGAIQDNEVQLLYQKTLDALASASAPIYVLGSDLYLSLKTSALAASIIGRNPERAGELGAMAEVELSSYVRSAVKETQHFAGRRLPYGFFRRQVRRIQLRRGR